MKLSEAMASLTPEQREAVEARFEALKIELAHAEGAAIIATDRPNEEFNERLAEMNAALRARVAEAVRMIEGYKRAGLLTNPAVAEQATDFISRATGNKTAASNEVPK